MRIVIDLQGAQTESRFRGIGRYSLSLTKAIIRNKGEHEIIIALSDLFPETIEHLRAEFEGILAQENIRIWNAIGPTHSCDPSNEANIKIAEYVREAFLESLQPDVILITSFFEGSYDNAITSISRFNHITPVAVILYDLIPLINPDENFKTNKLLKSWYQNKVSSLKNTSLLLCISNSVCREATELLSFDTSKITNISGAYDTDYFTNEKVSYDEIEKLFKRYNIKKPFVMYTGGADERKNLHRLINAYAKLDTELRDKYQLVFVGRMPDSHISQYEVLAKKLGIFDNLIITGYVPDKDLVLLYRTCSVFIFPSIHEGFGIPPLEAMACGAVIIGSNATSLPEVIGHEDALFDPLDVNEISNKLKRALIDEDYRKKLKLHGIEQTKKFTWDNSAKLVLNALNIFDNSNQVAIPHNIKLIKTSLFSRRKLKILLIKSDHMGDLILAIPAIAKLRSKYPYAEIDIIIGSWNKDLAKSLKIFQNIYCYDYFKKKSLETPELNEKEVAEIIKSLQNYDIAIDLRRQADTRFLLAQVNAKLKVGYATWNNQIDSKIDIILDSFQDIPYITTPLNNMPESLQIIKLIDALPSDVNDYINFPILIDTNNQRNLKSIAMFTKAGNDVKEWGDANYLTLINLLCDSDLVQNIDLFFADKQEAAEFYFMSNKQVNIHIGLNFADLIAKLLQSSICIANNSFGAHIASYLGLYVLGIYGGFETPYEWGSVFHYDYVLHRPIECSPCHIGNRLQCIDSLRCLTEITPEIVFSVTASLLKSIGDSKNKLVTRRCIETIQTNLIQSISPHIKTLNESQIIELSNSIASNMPFKVDKTIFVDLSELVQRDVKSGIQRVTRALLHEIITQPPAGWQVEPVYATLEQPGYRYARRFMSRFLGIPDDWAEDAPVETWPGDVFLGLDLQSAVVPAQEPTLQSWRRRGVKVYFVVYDLLPVTMPEVFPEGAREGHQRWLETITHFDGALAISRTVADELHDWLQTFGAPRERPFALHWFHLGADTKNSAPSRGLPAYTTETLVSLRARPTFLMVGTIEPRKGYKQTLLAFESLWKEGVDVNLVVVGKQGWMVEELVEKIRNHPQLNKRLFWLEGISDEYLEKVYVASTCLIAASEGEGFGLPLIEAAQHKLPIIARDIPVFREVAGEFAYYFKNSNDSSVLANIVISWLELYKDGRHPKSDDMPWLTWKQSAKTILEKINA